LVKPTIIRFRKIGRNGWHVEHKHALCTRDEAFVIEQY